MSKMQSWGNLSEENRGDYLNWTSVKLNVSNVIEDNISGEEIRYIQGYRAGVDIKQIMFIMSLIS